MKRCKIGMLVVMIAIFSIGCGSKETTNVDVSLDTVVNAVKEAYGEQYYPNMLEEEDVILDKYGLSSDMYEEIHAEVPMISVNIDTLVAVKVADGRQEEVAKALTDYREYLLSDSLQYPSNLLKLQGSKVIEKEGFVFFVSLGDIPMELEDENEIIAKAEELTLIAEEAIDSVLK